MKARRIITAALAAALPVVLMATPATAAKRSGDVEMTQNMASAGRAATAIPLPPPGPFKAPLKPVLSVPPMDMKSPAVSPEAAPEMVEPAAYPPVDFDPQAAAPVMTPEAENLPAATSAPLPAAAPAPFPAPEPANYPPLPDKNGETIIPPSPKFPAQVQTRTPPPPPAGGWQNYQPQAGRMPPAYGANPYARAPQPNWQQNQPQNWQRAPGWPAPNRPYSPYPVQPNPSGQTGRPTP